MKALNFFKNYGKSLVLAVGLLTGAALSNDASAQVKQQGKPKVDTLTNVKNRPIIKDGRKGTSDTLHIRIQKEDTTKTPMALPKKEIKKVVTKEVPNTEGIEEFKRKEAAKKAAASKEKNEEAWKDPKVREAYYNRLNSVPKTIPVKDTVPVLTVDTTALYNLLNEKQKIDTVRIENNFEDSIPVFITNPDTVYHQPFRVMAGLIERNTMGKKRDVNAPADREFTEVFPVAGHEKAKGKFIEISKDFGQIFRGYARAEWYENDTLTKLIAKDNMDATLVNTKAMSADFDNNYQFGVDVAPPIGWNGGKVKIGSKNILEDKLKRHNEKGSFALILQPSLGLNYRVAMNQSPKLVYIEQDRYDPNPVRLSMVQEQNMKTNSTALSVRGGMQAFVEYGKAFTRTKYKTDKDGKSVPHKVVVGEIAGFLNAGVMVNRTIAGGNPVLHQTATGEAYGAPKNFYTKQVAIGVKVSF